jgi:hypothetical protein
MLSVLRFTSVASTSSSRSSPWWLRTPQLHVATRSGDGVVPEWAIRHHTNSSRAHSKTSHPLSLLVPSLRTSQAIRPGYSTSSDASGVD